MRTNDATSMDHKVETMEHGEAERRGYSLKRKDNHVRRRTQGRRKNERKGDVKMCESKSKESHGTTEEKDEETLESANNEWQRQRRARSRKY